MKIRNGSSGMDGILFHRWIGRNRVIIHPRDRKEISLISVDVFRTGDAIYLGHLMEEERARTREYARAGAFRVHTKGDRSLFRSSCCSCLNTFSFFK